MKKPFGIFLTTCFTTWMAFAQTPTPTPTSSASPSPTPTTTPTPNPSVTPMWRCCIKSFRREECKLEVPLDETIPPYVITRFSAGRRLFLPEAPRTIEYQYPEDECRDPQTSYQPHWTHPQPYTCHVSDWLHFRTWYKWVDYGVMTQKECYEIYGGGDFPG